MSQRYAVEMDSSNKFFEGLDQLTGSKRVSDLVRYEIFNSVDEEGKENSLRQWFALDEDFLNIAWNHK